MHTTNGANTHNGHEFVDLGLPSGTLWATCNVGATSPEQAGLYFAFGETIGFTAEQVEKGVRKFDPASYTASKIFSELTLEDDAAHTYMGGKWRIPAKYEWQELIDNCNAVWTANYGGTGLAGHVFTSRVNGNSVFFPVVGRCHLSSVYGVGWYGNYWSATGLSSSRMWYLYFDSGHQVLDDYNRYYGFSVRGVCKR